MSLPDHVTISIIPTAVTLARASFGIVAVAAYLGASPPFADRVRTYESMAGVVADGIVSTGATAAAYAALAAAFAQKPCVEKVKLLRLTTAPTVLYTLTITDATEGKVYSGNTNGKSWSYTVLASATTSTVATAVASAITATTGVGGAASASAAVITFTPTTTSNRIKFDSLSAGITFAETTADPGLAAELDTIEALDSDWYGLGLASSGKAEIVAAAGWLASRVGLKIGVFQTLDGAVYNGASTTDVMASLKTANYGNSATIYTSNNFSFSGVAWMARCLAADPGTINWKFKNLQGVTVDALTASQSSAIKAKNGNCFTRDGGVPVTQEGVMADGTFIDFHHGIDWLQNEMQLRTFGVLAGNDNTPMTNAGRDMVVAGGIKSTLATAEKRGFLAPGWQIVQPDVDALDPSVRATRVLSGVGFDARGAGSINKVRITGYVGA